jgi:alkylation response protein AidB-like acyl-CoA dehydrogenase
MGTQLLNYQQCNRTLQNVVKNISNSPFDFGMALSDANHIADYSVVKYYASEMAVDVTQSALRILGGYGYFKEYPIKRYIRDAIIYVVGEGANEALLTSIGKQLIKEHSC